MVIRHADHSAKKVDIALFISSHNLHFLSVFRFGILC